MIPRSRRNSSSRLPLPVSTPAIREAGTHFSEREIWRVLIQVCKGLRALHDLNIMHRDLKSANVFLNQDFTAKLGDMNVSKLANNRGLNYT